MQWKRNQYPDCVSVAFVIKNGMRLRCTVICGMSGSTLSHKWDDFRKNKKVIEYRMFVLILSTNLLETFLILRRTE